jgi:hypothetical protein
MLKYVIAFVFFCASHFGYGDVFEFELVKKIREGMRGESDTLHFIDDEHVIVLDGSKAEVIRIDGKVVDTVETDRPINYDTLEKAVSNELISFTDYGGDSFYFDLDVKRFETYDEFHRNDGNMRLGTHWGSDTIHYLQKWYDQSRYTYEGAGSIPLVSYSTYNHRTRKHEINIIIVSGMRARLSPERDEILFIRGRGKSTSGEVYNGGICVSNSDGTNQRVIYGGKKPSNVGMSFLVL